MFLRWLSFKLGKHKSKSMDLHLCKSTDLVCACVCSRNQCVVQQLTRLPSEGPARDRQARCAYYLSMLLKLVHLKMFTRRCKYHAVCVWVCVGDCRIVFMCLYSCVTDDLFVFVQSGRRRNVLVSSRTSWWRASQWRPSTRAGRLSTALPTAGGTGDCSGFLKTFITAVLCLRVQGTEYGVDIHACKGSCLLPGLVATHGSHDCWPHSPSPRPGDHRD